MVGLGFCSWSWRNHADDKLGRSGAESLETCHRWCEFSSFQLQ